MATPVLLPAWLRGQASHDMLLSAWQAAAARPLSLYEVDALAAAALATKLNSKISVLLPSGHSRLPLLAAVHAAALQMDGFPSPFSPTSRGHVVFASRMTVRRTELLELDAAGVPITPALHPVRLRQDGHVVPLHGGRPRPLEAHTKLVLVRDFRTAPPAGVSVLIVDGDDNDDIFLAAAEHWATRHHVESLVVFDDITRHRPITGAAQFCAGWAHSRAAGAPQESNFARLRGHATVLDAGAFSELEQSAVLLAEARHRGELPGTLIEASTLWRRLDELVTPITDYDSSCRRYHMPTLSERLQNLDTVTAHSFPSHWQLWAQGSWAGVKERILLAAEKLAHHNEKDNLLIDLVDREIRAGHGIDVALASRTARDATQRHLDQAGVVTAMDGHLTLRSLRDVERQRPAPATLLASPPSAALRHRLTATDVGTLNVLTYRHETGGLRRALTRNLTERKQPDSLLTFLPPALHSMVPAEPPPTVVLLERPKPMPGCHGNDVAHLASLIDLAALSALQSTQHQVDVELPEDNQVEPGPDIIDLGSDPGAGKVTIYATAGLEQAQRRFVLPPGKPVMRLLNQRATTIAARDLSAGMLVVGIDGPTPFQRLRPMLMEARGVVPRMLLIAWGCALDAALEARGGPGGLQLALAAKGSTVAAQAVATWSSADRIGPRDPMDVQRVGRIAEHDLVIHHATTIANIMGQLRVLHQSVGRLIGDVVNSEEDAASNLARLIGDDAISMLQETVVYRLVAVNTVCAADRQTASASPASLMQPEDAP